MITNTSNDFQTNGKYENEKPKTGTKIKKKKETKKERRKTNELNRFYIQIIGYLNKYISRFVGRHIYGYLNRESV